MKTASGPLLLALLSFSAGCYASHEVPDLGPVEATCIPQEMGILPGDYLALQSSLNRPLDASDWSEWSIIRGDGNAVSLQVSDDPLAATVKGERGGHAVVAFSLRDAMGRRTSCESTVVVVSGAPYVNCLSVEKTVALGIPLTLRPVVVEDVGIEEAGFTPLEAPAGASLSPSAGDTFSLVPTLEGEYRIEFAVRDVEGYESSCVFEFYAAPPPGIRCPETTTLYASEEGVLGRLNVEATEPSRVWLTTDELDDDAWMGTIDESSEVSLTVETRGSFTFHAVVEDALGLRASCEMEVHVIRREPWALCPSKVAGAPLQEVRITGQAGDDDGELVAAHWRLDEAPLGSRAELSSGEGLSAAFTPDLVGTYRAELTVRDDEGNEGHCTTHIRVAPPGGLYVELVWDTDADFDLYLLHPDATHWAYDRPPYLECSWYSMCDDAPIPWFGPSGEDDPRLLRDDQVGFGPEVIYIAKPPPGSYAVGVGSYKNYRYPRTSEFRGNAELRVHCGPPGGSIETRLGPVPLDAEHFWRAAEIEVDEDGRCRIMEIPGLDGRAPDLCLRWVADALRSGFVIHHPPYEP